MTALLYILPVVFVALAVGAFFINVHDGKGKYILMGAAGVLCIMLIGNEIAVFMQVKKINTLQEQLAEIEQWKMTQITRMNTLLASFSNDIDQERTDFKQLTRLGWKTNNPIFLEAKAAHAARNELIQYVPMPKNPVVIENLPHSVDKMLVSLALEEMGFLVSALQTRDSARPMPDEKPSNTTNTMAQDDFDDSFDGPEITPEETTTSDQVSTLDLEPELKPEVNGLYFGHLVRNNDIKLILYTMMRAGIRIRQVKVFQDKTDDNARHVKFVHSKALNKRPPLNVEQIQMIKAFKR